MNLRILISPLLLLALGLTAGAETLNLTASQCREMALESSRQIKAADNSLEMARLDVGIATTNYLPKFDATAGAEYMFPDMDMMGTKLQMRGMYLAGFQLTQPVYAGGKITAGRRLAKIGQKASEQQRRMTEAEVIANADNAYWNYVSVLGKVALMESYAAMMDTLRAQTEVAVAVGMAVSNDLLRVDAHRSEILYQQQKVANGAELCRMALCEAIGVEYDTEIIPADGDTETPALPAQLSSDISDRPELHLLQTQVEAQNKMTSLVRGDFLPTVGLSASWFWYGNVKMKGQAEVAPGVMYPYTQTINDGIGMVMLAVKVPLFHWGEGVKKVRKARIEAKNAQLDLERNERLLTLEARQASLNVQEGHSLIRTAETALAQAKENLRVTTDRHTEHMCPLSDLLDAQSQWQKASADLIEARAQYRIYLTAWRKATGTLDQTAF